MGEGREEGGGEEGEREKTRLGRKRSRRKGLRVKGGVSGTKEVLKWEGEEMPNRGASD